MGNYLQKFKAFLLVALLGMGLSLLGSISLPHLLNRAVGSEISTFECFWLVYSILLISLLVFFFFRGLKWIYEDFWVNAS